MDEPIRPSPLRAAGAARLLHGMSLADAFRKYVILDDVVIALGNDLKGRDKWFVRTLDDGVFPHYLVNWLWPVLLRRDYLVANWGETIVRFVNEPIRRPPDHLLPLADALCDRFDALMGPLRNGDVLANGSAKTGTTTEIPRTQWSRPRVHIDVRNNDLVEWETGPHEVIWTGIVLSAANSDNTKPQPEKSRGGRPPKYPCDDVIDELMLKVSHAGLPESQEELIEWIAALPAFIPDQVPDESTIRYFLSTRLPKMAKAVNKKA